MLSARFDSPYALAMDSKWVVNVVNWRPVVVAVVLLATGALAWVLSGGLTENPVVTTPQPTVTPLPLEERIPLQIVAVRPNGPSFAVLNFEQGTMAMYPPGVHRSTQDATDGVALTSDEGLVVYGSGFGAVYLFRDGLEQEPVVFRPEVLREVPGIASEVFAIPSSDGTSLWLFQPGFVTPDDAYSGVVELVDSSTGQHLLDPTLLDPTTSAAGVTHQGLVLEIESLTDTGSGFVTDVGSEHVSLLSEDGTIGEIGLGRAVEAAGDTVVRLVCDQGEEPCELVISDPDGSNERTVPRPVEGNWGRLGGPGIPSVSLPLDAIAPDGSSLIMSIGSDFDVNGVPARWGLWLVDVGDLTTREVARLEGSHRLATWSRDNNWIVVMDQSNVELINEADPEQVISLPGLIPADHFPLAAG